MKVYKKFKVKHCLPVALVLTLAPSGLGVGARSVGKAVAHAVEVVRRDGGALRRHGALRRGGGYAVAVADNGSLVLRHAGNESKSCNEGEE